VDTGEYALAQPGTDHDSSANKPASADHKLTTRRKARKPFPFEQDSEEVFARCRRLMPDSIDAKYTYFMRDRRNGLIKIGRSRDPDERCKRLSSSGRHDMEVLVVLRDGYLEGCYHQHFADLCVGGEWFEPHPDILAEITRLSTQGEVRRGN
jgi:hypothetical protein